ncbi:MAG: DUF3536 domain-containing protein [Deltaproteobacteria bacterium]|nr:DUF3536 domain-containing protein [Deltaproteobacteria bacterium]
MTRYVCVHGHFYQPPRENPWLEIVEPQPSAAPYPDWNARITAECYRPNTAARIVDGEGRIIRIVDNFERMSWNVGPTLLTWLEREAPDVHEALVAADVASRARFGGHGSAMAQAYNHLILPLASERDRVTQVRWGIADFRHRFGRAPEGMWLPECAVDTPSLETLAAEGIAFTVLAPSQARRVRSPDGVWHDGVPDTGRPYRCALPSGRTIDLFFYDGTTSQAIAFEKLTASGDALAGRLCAGADDRLMHVATDGETYGHHHRYGDMGLAWTLWAIEHGLGGAAGKRARLTNYAEYRTIAPATWDVEIVERSAWSCAHGVGRWCEDCGCNMGGNHGWNQKWRRPLRIALDLLAARAAEALEVGARGLLIDPWAARDAYIEVILDRSPATIDAFLARHQARPLTELEVSQVLALMELGRNAQLMFTSCGWFFDDLAGIETVQCLRYAARVCELAERVLGPGVEAAFVDELALARSNRPEAGDGRAIWTREVVPTRVDLAHVAAHQLVHAMIDEGKAGSSPSHGRCYEVTRQDSIQRRTGKARMFAERVRVRSRLTGEAAELCVAILHLGEHHLTGGVKEIEPAAWRALCGELSDAFLDGDLFAVQRQLDGAFAGFTFSLGTLLPADRRAAIARILAEPLAAAEAELARVYDRHAPLMRYLVKEGLPVPEVLRTAAELTLRRRLLYNLESEGPSYYPLRAHIAEAEQVSVELDTPEIAYAAGRALALVVDRAVEHPDDDRLLGQVASMAMVALRMKSPVDFWHAQNAAYRLAETHAPAWRAAAAAGNEGAGRKLVELERLARAVGLAL